MGGFTLSNCCGTINESGSPELCEREKGWGGRNERKIFVDVATIMSPLE